MTLRPESVGLGLWEPLRLGEVFVMVIRLGEAFVTVIRLGEAFVMVIRLGEAFLMVKRLGEAFVMVKRLGEPESVRLLGDSDGVVNSLDFCPALLKSLGCFYFWCVLSSQWKAVTVNLRILYSQF